MQKINSCSECTGDIQARCMEELASTSVSIKTHIDIGMNNALDCPEMFKESVEAVERTLDSAMSHLAEIGCTNNSATIRANLNGFVTVNFI